MAMKINTSLAIVFSVALSVAVFFLLNPWGALDAIQGHETLLTLTLTVDLALASIVFLAFRGKEKIKHAFLAILILSIIVDAVMWSQAEALTWIETYNSMIYLWILFVFMLAIAVPALYRPNKKTEVGDGNTPKKRRAKMGRKK